MPSHYLNQLWLIVDSTLRNKLRWTFNQNATMSIQENWFENVTAVSKMTAISSWHDDVMAWKRFLHYGPYITGGSMLMYMLRNRIHCYSRYSVSIMVTDAQVPTWRQDICNHHGEVHWSTPWHQGIFSHHGNVSWSASIWRQDISNAYIRSAPRNWWQNQQWHNTTFLSFEVKSSFCGWRQYNFFTTNADNLTPSHQT